MQPNLEQRAWFVSLGVPLLVAAAFFATALAAADASEWARSALFVPVILLPAVWAAVLAYLAVASDVNALTHAQVVELERHDEQLRRAA